MLEKGHGILGAHASEWLPKPCSAERVCRAIAETDLRYCREYALSKGAVDPKIGHVELLAIAYGILRDEKTPDGVKCCRETLEILGYSVCPEFSESGRDALDVFNAINALETGTRDQLVARDRVCQSLARLWSKAFDAPSGYWHYIFRSVYGLIPAENSFLKGVLNEQAGIGSADFFLRCMNLIEIGICARKQPIKWLGRRITLPSGGKVVGYIESGMHAKYPEPVYVHVIRDTLVEDKYEKIGVRLTYGASEATIGYGVAHVVTSDTGEWEDVLEMSKSFGGFVEKVMESVFDGSDIATIYPRVRRLLDKSNNDMTRVMLVGSLYVAPEWRTRSMGRRLFSQLMLATGEVDMALGIPAISYWGEANDSHPEWMLGALLASNIRICAYMGEELWAKYLINGVVGMSHDICALHFHEGLHERVPIDKREWFTESDQD